MALRSGYKGYKKLAEGLKEFWPGILGADIPALKKTFLDWSSYAKTGAYNFLDTRLETLKKINTEGTWSGNVYTLHNVTFTVSDDDKIAMTGTSSDVTYFNLDTNFNATNYNGWVVNGLPVDGSVPTYVFRISNSTSDRVSLEDMLHAEGDLVSVTGTGKCLAIRLHSSYNPNGAVISPMLSVKGGTYVPFAMTNEELTETVTVVDGACTDIITGAEVDNSQNGGNVVHVIGNIAFLNIALLHVTASAWANLFNIPSNALPKHNLRFRDVQQNKVFQMTTGGVVQCSEALTDVPVVISISWVI